MSGTGYPVCRGVRGATTAQENTRDQILLESRRLLALMIRLNGIEADDVASVIFSVTADLNAEFPAFAARQLGWMQVPLLCTNEIDVPGALGRCIRVLINWNTVKSPQDIQHVYVREATQLRPDQCTFPAADWDELEDWIDEYTKDTNSQ